MTGPRPTVNTTRQARRSETLLCAAEHCRARGRHHPDCVVECRGCLPRQAADGVYLCQVHRDNIGEDALLAAVRWQDLGIVLTGSSAPGDVISGSSDPSLKINLRAVELRATVRHTLAAITKLISEDRGFALPEDTVPAMARFVARNRDWLAAHEAAGDHSAELRELAHGESYRVAYPSGGRKFQLRDPSGATVRCIEQVDDGEECPGTLWTILRRTDSMLPSELVCEHDEEHRVSAADWLRMGRRLNRASAEQVRAVPARGTRVQLIGGPFDGATHTLTASPPPAVLPLTVTEIQPDGSEKRYSVAYTRRDATLYEYVGTTS